MAKRETLAEINAELKEINNRIMELDKQSETLLTKEERQIKKELSAKLKGRWFKKVDIDSANAIGGDGVTYYYVRKVDGLERSYNHYPDDVRFTAVCACVEVNVERNCFIGHCREVKSVHIRENMDEVTANEVIRAINAKRVSQDKMYETMIAKVGTLGSHTMHYKKAR